MSDLGRKTGHGLDRVADREVPPPEIDRQPAGAGRLVDEPGDDDTARHEPDPAAVALDVGDEPLDRGAHRTGNVLADVVRRGLGGVDERAQIPIDEGGLDPGATDVDRGDDIHGRRHVSAAPASG